jgi:hypothetical protein
MEFLKDIIGVAIPDTDGGLVKYIVKEGILLEGV